MTVNNAVDKLPWKIKVTKKNREFFLKNGRFPCWKEYQELHNFKETDYGVKNNEWNMLDYANPAWQPADYTLRYKL